MRTRCGASPLPGAPGMSPEQNAPHRFGRAPDWTCGHRPEESQPPGDLAFMGDRQAHQDWQRHDAETSTPGVFAQGGTGLVTGSSQHRAGPG